MKLFEKLPLFLRPPFPLLRRGFRWSTLAALLLAIELVYLFIVTAGTFTEWPTYNALYELLADGFKKGQLSLPITPPPELVAKENPLDPANAELWIADLSLYKGKYYMYWGPFPSLALLAAKAILNIKKPIGDQYPCFAFYTIYLLAGTLLLHRMARRVFPGLPYYFVLMAIAVFAFASPTPYLLATPGIYEAAIGGAQAFLLLGVVFAFDALGGVRPFSRLRLLAAGISWSMAIACRVSVGPTVLLVALLTALVPHRGAQRRWVSALVDLTCLGAPVALATAALLFYNKARFDSWLEFGTGVQLNTMHFRASADYVVPNLYSYFLRWPVFSCQFPFATSPWDHGQAAFPVHYEIPSGYWVQEPVAGMLRVVPWAWLAPLGLVFAAQAAWARFIPAALPQSHAPSRSSLWCAGAFAVLAAVTALPFVATFGATMRYLGDVTAGFMLFATWGAWGLYQRIRKRKWLRRGYGAVLTGLAAGTVALGLVFGFQGYGGHFKLYNPTLTEKMVRTLSRCD
ncbi:MAG TPA: hypothetical protein VK540_28985 [Polyangiaceae bacterium]|nr:hypothetical protein [Polyangiaceae bacterium]